jgi:hypothetical protein
VSLRKLITAAAGTDGITLVPVFDLLLAIVNLDASFESEPLVLRTGL